jgi:hypothetical protein
MAAATAPAKPPGPRYERRGECKQCGQCCLNEDCPSLSFEDDKAVCLQHPTITGGADQREPKCGWFPQAPPILYEECGYWFVDTWEGDRRVGPREV